MGLGSLFVADDWGWRLNHVLRLDRLIEEPTGELRGRPCRPTFGLDDKSFQYDNLK